MKYNKEEFSKKFDLIRDPGSLSWNPREYKWIWTEDAAETFKPELNEDELSRKERIEQEVNACWDKLKEEVFKCLDIYVSKDDTTFLKAFIDVSKAYSSLWRVGPFFWNHLSMILEFFQELDRSRFDSLEQQLWFILYSFNRGSDNAKEDFLVGIIENELAMDFPYPEYYEYEVKKLFDIADYLESGEDNARLSYKFFHLGF